MSDILIKGIQMPKNCAECQFSDVFAYPPDYDDEWICELNQLSMSWEDAQIRNSNCPLIPVPPHVDLVDKDALPTNQVELEDIVNTPASIKADEADMDSFIRIFEEDDEKDGMDSFIRILKD